MAKKETVKKNAGKPADTAAKAKAPTHKRTGNRSNAKNAKNTKNHNNSRRPASASEQAIKDRIKNLSSYSFDDVLTELDEPAPVSKKNNSGAKKQSKKIPDFYPPEPKKKNAQPKSKLRIIPLGGLEEVGKNITAIEYGNDIMIVDCGVGFPDDDMPGVDLVVPDFSYLESNRDKIRGLVLTHGHEDHIGSIPYLLSSVNVPVYGTRLTLKIVENKLKEWQLPWEANLRCVEAGDTIKLGCFSVEFIRVNHSIADACCLSIGTPVGTVVHSGDFKLDLTPIEGDIMNITRLGEIGKKGVLLLMCESTNAERPGYTPSEKTVGRSLEYIFTTHADKRIIISTFSSNVHRVQQVLDASVRHGRKVVITGRSMINIISSAIELGYMKLPEGLIIDVGDMKRYRPSELTVVCTGSQGEPMSALHRMAFGDKTQIPLGQSDVVVISASAIPGNEKLVGNIINELCKKGIEVVNDSSMGVHVSGHACAEEIKLMQALTKPKFFMPVHGEARHLQANRNLAREMGIDDGHIFVSRIGQVLELDKSSAKFAGTVQSGNVMVDGTGVGEVGDIVLRERKLLADDGLIVVFAAVDLTEKMILTRPDIISRGFVYMRESGELMDELRELAANIMSQALSRRGQMDRTQLKNRIRDEISRFIYSKTKRRPVILPIIIDL